MAGKVRKQIKQGGWLSVIALTSLFVSVFTLFYIFRHSVQFNLWGTAEWLMFWQLAVVSVTAVIALGTIFIKISSPVETPPFREDNQIGRDVTSSNSGQHVGRRFMCRPTC